MDVEGAAARVARLVEHEHPPRRAQIDAVEPLTGGLSRGTWRARGRLLGDPTEELDLVVQVLPPSGLLDSDLAAEMRLLRRLEGDVVPAPRPVAVDPDGSVFGSPALVTRFLHGTCDPFVLRGTMPVEERVHLARQLMGLLAALSKVDVGAESFDGVLTDPGEAAAQAAVDAWATRLAEVALEPHPELSVVISWLRRRAVASPHRVLVHGDFKPGNVMVDGTGVVALLDWETAHLGSPLEDLGWVTNPVRKAEHQIPGHWEVPQMVRAFEETTGITVDPNELLWWNVFSCFKLAVIVLTGVHGYAGRESSVLHHPPTWLYRAMFSMIRESM